MTVTLFHTGRRPGQTQYGLDTFTETYKCNSKADDVMLATNVPQRGDAHPDYASMFVTDRYISETGESASSLDVTYMGTLSGDLPPQKATSGGEIASATTNTSSAIFPATATNPATVQFYAITSTLSFVSDNIADASEPTDPPTITDLITWDLGFGLQPGISMPDLVTFLLTEAFVQGIIETPPEIEPLVDGQFWQITKKKTRTLFPYAPAS